MNYTTKHWTEYTPFEWLMIDAASRYGLDKDQNVDRIKWCVEELLPVIKIAGNDEAFLKQLLKGFVEKADEKPMFVGACLAIFDTINGRESTWQVGQDAASSGPQLLSVLLKDVTGMANTGVLGTDVPDVYTTVTKRLNQISKGKELPRKVVKKAIVPHIYASEKAPKAVFGKRYPEFLRAYTDCLEMAQFASDLMVGAWDSNANEHCWMTPDGADIRVPVIVKGEKTLPMGKHSFKYQFNTIGTIEAGKQGTKSLSANTTHSYDAYMLRELNRRCNYDRNKLLGLQNVFMDCKNTRVVVPNAAYFKVAQLDALFTENNQISAVIFEYLDSYNIQLLSKENHHKIYDLLSTMLAYQPFEITNIHDEFKTLPKDVVTMKLTYNRLLQEAYLSLWWINTAKKLTGTDHSISIEAPISAVHDEIINAPYSIG